ncbi:hypothetical protein LguiB_024062 [Lonicera macranthoides]
MNPGSFRLQPWCNDFNPANQKHSTAQVWIRLHDITQEYWDPQLLISIASLVGIPQAIDPSTLSFMYGHYARIQVEIDLIHTLPSRLLVKREGYSFEVPVTFESLLKFCTHCQLMGHFVGECKTLRRIQESIVKTTHKQTAKSEIAHKSTVANVKNHKQAHHVPTSSAAANASVTTEKTKAEKHLSMPQNASLAIKEVFGS